MVVRTQVVPKNRLHRVWPMIAPGIEIYRGKSPHQVNEAQEIYAYLASEDGDELLVATIDGEYGGFITFKVQELEGEVWGTMAMIFLTPVAQAKDALPEICNQLEEVLRGRGCNVMNYMTARKGFQRLAPKLGFRARIVEWMKEIN